jgi:hypothetical protein
MMRFAPPPGGESFFDFAPGPFRAFNVMYGRLWTEGGLDQPTKEVARLRNARVVDCGI